MFGVLTQNLDIYINLPYLTDHFFALHAFSAQILNLYFLHLYCCLSFQSESESQRGGLIFPINQGMVYLDHCLQHLRQGFTHRGPQDRDRLIGSHALSFFSESFGKKLKVKSLGNSRVSLPAHILLLLLWFSEWVDGEEGCGKFFGVRGGKWGCGGEPE